MHNINTKRETMMDGMRAWVYTHQASITMAAALFAFALLAMCPVKADAADITARMESHELKFKAQCIRGADSAEMWVSSLVTEWGEAPVFIGKNQGGRIMVMRNSHNPTWTFLIETPSGTCLVSSGDEHFLNSVDGTGPKVPSKTDSGSVDDDRV